ncbi:MAG TPA: tetratricopeptide repeat protein [Clostridiales bacterium]|nr:tetratricopeptide repeat protein [Clostridiales bacterium]
MKNLIPQFIAEKYKAGKGSGTISGSVMSLDLKGFTKMTGELMKNGKYGAEILSDIINGVFGPVISSIYENGGFITAFVGDAITAVFPEGSAQNAELCAKDITGHFKKNKNVTVEKKKYPISVRIGISYGDIDWNIISTPERSVYFFKGETVYKAADAQQKAEPGEYLKDASYSFPSHNKKTSSRVSKALAKKILERFVPDRVLEMSAAGEFREIISVYISFEEKETDIVELSKALCADSVRYKGYLNKIDFGDKGGIALVFFGAPLKEEKYPEYAVSFATDIVKRFPAIKIGIAKGTAFCGFVGNDLRSEYTAMGEVVNLSARLLGVTPAGEVTTDEWTTEYKYRNFSFAEKGSHLFKGFSSELKVFSPEESRKKKNKAVHPSAFVGRDAEIKRLKLKLRPVLSKEFAGYIQINGNPGIGKTLLFEKAYEKMHKVQKFVFSCDTVTAKSFQPVISFISDYLEITEDMPDEDKLRLLEKNINSRKSLYFIGNVLGIGIKDPVLDRLEGSDRYDNTLIELKNLFLKIVSEKPSVLLIDDIHKADRGTLDLINTLIRSDSRTPLCLIGTARLDDKGRRFDPGFEIYYKDHIDLDVLTRSASASIAENLLGGKINEELAGTVFEKTNGNPFYIEQLVLYLKDTVKVELRKELYALTGKEYSIPESINSVVVSRIDRLSAELRTTLSAASVLGKEFSVKILTGMLKNRNTDKSVKIIEDEAFWFQLSEMMYIFKHALIRDSIYQMQLKKTLKELHLLAAETILQIHSNDSENYYSDLAYHFENAGNRKEARLYTSKAAKSAYSRHHLAESLDHYLKLQEYLRSGKELCRIKFTIGDLLYYLGDWPESEKYFLKSLELADNLNNTGLIVRANISYAELLAEKGEMKKAKSLLLKIEKTASENGLNKERASILSSIGVLERLMSNYPGAVKYYKKAMAVKVRVKDSSFICGVTDNMGVAYMNMGEYKKAGRYFSEAINIAKKYGDEKGLMFSLSNAAIIEYNQGNIKKALEMYKESLESAERIGIVRHKSVIYSHLASISYYQNDIETAYDYSMKGYKIAADLGDIGTMSYHCASGGVLSRLLGDNKRAIELFNEQRILAEKLKNHEQIAAAISNLALMHSLAGEFEKSNAMYKKSINIRRKIGEKSGLSCDLASIAENCRMTKDYSKIIDLYKSGLGISEKAGFKYNLMPGYFYFAEALTDMNEMKRADEYYTRSLELAEELNRNDYIVRCRMRILSADINKKSSEKEKALLLLMRQNSDQRNEAELYMTLYRVSGKVMYKEKAGSVLKELYSKYKYFEYKKALEEMGYTV